MSFLPDVLDEAAALLVEGRLSTLLVTGPPQSGKSWALRIVAERLLLASAAPPTTVTPEQLAADSPGDAARGLLHALLPLDEVGAGARVVIFEDADLVAPPSRRGGDAAARVLCRALRRCHARAQAPSSGRQRPRPRLVLLAVCGDPRHLHPAVRSLFEREVVLGPLRGAAERLQVLRALAGAADLLEAGGANDAARTLGPGLTERDLEHVASAAGHGFMVGDVALVLAAAREQLRLLFSGGGGEYCVGNAGGAGAAGAAGPLGPQSPRAVLLACCAAHTPLFLRSGAGAGSAPQPLRSRCGGHDGSAGAALAAMRGLPGVIDVCDWRPPAAPPAAAADAGAVEFRAADESAGDDGGWGDNGEEREEKGAGMEGEGPWGASGRRRGGDSTAGDGDEGDAPPPSSFARLLRPAAPGLRLRDVGGQCAAKAAIAQLVLWPLRPRRAAAMRRLGVRAPTGLLLFGPPGTGKTLLARALAAELGGRFICLPMPAVLRPGVGDSERALAAAFAMAQAAAPSVLFVDEVQALFARRGAGQGAGDESDRMAANLTAQLLLSMDALRASADAADDEADADAAANAAAADGEDEMCGSIDRGGGDSDDDDDNCGAEGTRAPRRCVDSRRVVVVAATNVPEALDPALLRPGRFDRCVYVGLPDAAERTSIFAARLAPLDVTAADDAASDVEARDEGDGEDGSEGGEGENVGGEEGEGESAAPIGAPYTAPLAPAPRPASGLGPEAKVALASTLAARSEGVGLSGADIAGVFRVAAAQAVRRWLQQRGRDPASAPAGPRLSASGLVRALGAAVAAAAAGPGALERRDRQRALAAWRPR